MSDLITIVLPVFGRSTLLGKALNSVYAQDDSHWRLLIADDGSSGCAAELIRQQQYDPRVDVSTRPHNLGLFGNLNAAIKEVKTSWQLILCSDDVLEPHAISRLKSLIASHPSARLILSSYRSIDSDGNPRVDVNGLFYDRFAPTSKLFSPGTLLPYLLQYGSINGNITGLLIHQSLFTNAGLWRSDWHQSADWEWLTRACCQTSVFVSRDPIARVRVHDGQLSVSNRKFQRENSETLEILKELLSHPQLQGCHRRQQWAAHHAQFLMWNALKAMPRVGIYATLHQFALIEKNVGLLSTLFALIRALPMRFKNRGTQHPLLPPF